MRTRTGAIGIAAFLALVLLGGQSGAGQTEGASSARAPVPSLGCGVSDAEPGVVQLQTLVVGDDERRWSAFVPQVHDGMSPVPLWVQVHGKDGWSFSELSRIKSTAETHGYVVVAPEGNLGNPRWLWQKEDREVDLTQANPDIAFIAALIDHLGEMLCLDLARVYAAGQSQGGYAVNGLACVLEDRLAAIATSSAMIDLGERCELERPVPVLHVHGLRDRYVDFDEGLTDHPASLSLSGEGELVRYGDHPIVKAHMDSSIPTRLTGIAMRNGCEPEPNIEAIGDDLERWTWDCPTGSEVELVVHGGSEGWPMAEPVSISERIWEFFEQHPMPE